MKLVLAIIQDDDSLECIESLNENGFIVTKLATTGGFLKSGNTTLMIGVEKEKVDKVISIIDKTCRKRREDMLTPNATDISVASTVYVPYQVEVEVGGGTIFVVDVDKFIKL